MLLDIQSLLRGDYESLLFKLSIVAIMWLLVSVAIVMDLISGVRKAKERNELHTSEGFRQTVSKVVQYYSFLIFAFLFDGMLMLILYVFGLEEFRILPFSSIACACFLVFIEWKSFMEKASDKHRMQFRRSAHDLAVLLDNRDDILNGLADVIRQHSTDKIIIEETDEKNR